jgi:hypothetical protein
VSRQITQIRRVDRSHRTSPPTHAMPASASMPAPHVDDDRHERRAPLDDHIRSGATPAPECHRLCIAAHAPAHRTMPQHTERWLRTPNDGLHGSCAARCQRMRRRSRVDHDPVLGAPARSTAGGAQHHAPSRGRTPRTHRGPRADHGVEQTGVHVAELRCRSRRSGAQLRTWSLACTPGATSSSSVILHIGGDATNTSAGHAGTSRSPPPSTAAGPEIARLAVKVARIVEKRPRSPHRSGDVTPRTRGLRPVNIDSWGGHSRSVCPTH